jgi:hypothetical protein
MSDTTTNPGEKPVNDGGTTPQADSETTEEEGAAEVQASQEAGSD